ncbi:MAG TPA: N-succinylarginine dihydrolase [Polyangiaceae bacterium LLY-WYZ-15_(1-7)]|nr:succinylarginine dihydrolase [Sandaracinus sp.]HJL01825.1 N-succinylarginine dihydrolase [Polyangiaceae bacterium LLY-WYZ-15_(1-7)]MBJ70590.1 succinylarginine dihydrolase [Sandaracinus sp.]HJL09131.1 N-succinylarginine dihydrolase [Polyangiaceae bacterium LLY-WYZ-15_(1-7)]HJL21909.1 N-succinylarginine dihydrolase [Polyangiaceae bacterium LLY-WYZ-15_(1-7)]
MATRLEMNFDGLVGPSHNYAGLAIGNVASATHAGQASAPRRAVIEGLEKMAALHALGVPQGLLPPQERPRLDVLRELGFAGADEAALLAAAAKEAPGILAAVYSASAMWSANAATISPSGDTSDGRVHISPANLQSSFHRSLEAADTARALARLFPGERFRHHAPLPATPAFGDEGAANHTYLDAPGGGLEVFVFGRASSGPTPTRFPARQTRAASEAVARRHGLAPERALFLQQRPEAIDAGVFHNDVIAVGHGRWLLWHEQAFLAEDAVARIRERFAALGGELVSWRVTSEELSVAEAVRTYLFNSQIVSTGAGPVLIAPKECEESDAARAVVERLKGEGLADARFLDVRQSMRNGGGPACLRLRVQLGEEERAAIHPGAAYTPERHAALKAWAEKHYREELKPAELADPRLPGEIRAALDELTQLLDLGGDFYRFQRA